MVIVTQNQYILATKIHHITMDEQFDHKEIYLHNGRRKTVVEKYFQITVIYTPDTTAQQHNGNARHDEIRECSVILRGAVNAHLVFKNLIQQIREQMPDQLYLDKALENMLAGIDLNSLKEKDAEDKLLLEIGNDRSAKTVRRARKTKRAGKAVLRKSKKRR